MLEDLDTVVAVHRRMEVHAFDFYQIKFAIRLGMATDNS